MGLTSLTVILPQFVSRSFSKDNPTGHSERKKKKR